MANYSEHRYQGYGVSKSSQALLNTMHHLPFKDTRTSDKPSLLYRSSSGFSDLILLKPTAFETFRRLQAANSLS